MPVNVTRPPGIDLTRFIQDDARIDFVATRTGTSTPTLEQIDRLVRARDLPQTEREWLQTLLESARGTTRADGMAAVTNEGLRRPHDLRIDTLIAANRARGDSELEATVRTRMVDGAIGQAQVIEAFVEATRDYASPQRFSPPLLAIRGPAGHGKDQAVAHFAQALSSCEPRVVDLSRATDDPQVLARLLTGDGPLATDALTAAAAGGTSVVWLKGVDDLATRAPDLADAISRLLCADRDNGIDDSYVHVVYVLDFDGKPGESAADAAEQAFGAVAHRKLSADASFNHLDAEAMETYAEASLARRFQANRALSKLVLQYDDVGLQTLGKALATTHAPLFELDDRLFKLVLGRFDVHQLQHPDGGVLRFQLAEPYASDPRKRQEKIDALHLPRANLRQAEDLFLVSEVGVLAGSAAEIARLTAVAEALDDGMVKIAIADTGAGDGGSVDRLIAAMRAYSDAAVVLRDAEPGSSSPGWETVAGAAREARDALGSEDVPEALRAIAREGLDIADAALPAPHRPRRS